MGFDDAMKGWGERWALLLEWAAVVVVELRLNSEEECGR